MPALRMPLLRADQLQTGDHVTQAATITSHASIMVWREGIHVGNMTEAQLRKALPSTIRHPRAGRDMGTNQLVTIAPAAAHLASADEMATRACIQRTTHA